MCTYLKNTNDILFVIFKLLNMSTCWWLWQAWCLCSYQL